MRLYLKKNIRNFWFSGFVSSFWNIRRFLSFWQEISVSLKYMKLFKCGFFYFSSTESYFLKCKKFFRVSFPEIYKKIRCFRLLVKCTKCFRGFVSRNIRKAFFWENIRSFLISELESSVIPEYKKLSRVGFFKIFLSLGWKVPIPEI